MPKRVKNGVFDPLLRRTLFPPLGISGQNRVFLKEIDFGGKKCGIFDFSKIGEKISKMEISKKMAILAIFEILKKSDFLITFLDHLLKPYFSKPPPKRA